MKWIISDADIPSFVKMLKSMAKIGNELHLETVNETHLKLQVINPSHSVHFELILTEEFFVDCEPSETNDTCGSEMAGNSRCKLPLKYLMKCCSTQVCKVTDQLELELTDVQLILGIVGTAGWKRSFTFNVLNCDAITSRISINQTLRPFVKCPVSVFVAECRTFPRGIMEVSLWLDKQRLHLKSYNKTQGLMKTNVRSEVSIPLSELEITDQVEGSLTFSLQEFMATVELWDQILDEDATVAMYNDGPGTPVVLTLEHGRMSSQLVTATLNADEDDINRQISQQSFLLDQSQTESTKKRKSTTLGQKSKRTRIEPQTVEEMLPTPSPPALPPPVVCETSIAPSHGDQLLFGGESSSDEDASVYLGPKSRMANDRTNNLLFGGADSTVEETQSQAKSRVNNAPILCYDSD